MIARMWRGWAPPETADDYRRITVLASHGAVLARHVAVLASGVGVLAGDDDAGHS
jgi:hypothetical protein